jgi:hypothetical protein
LAVATIAGLGLQCAARADDTGGAYFGGSFGRAHNTYDTGSLDSQLDAEAVASGDSIAYTSRSTRRMSDAWWGDAGYLFNPYIGIEAAFIHLGEIKYRSVGSLTTASGNDSISSATEISSEGPALSVVLRLPLTEEFALDLHAGDYYGKAKASANLAVASNSAPTSSSSSSSSLLVGVGAAYTIAAHWSLRGEVLRINKAGDSAVGTFSVNVVAVGASFTF